MKPKTAIIAFIISNALIIIGVAIFISNESLRDISRVIMTIGILFYAVCAFGVVSIFSKSTSSSLFQFGFKKHEGNNFLHAFLVIWFAIFWFYFKLPQKLLKII